jgi:molybdopterin molybdotransferase
MISENEARAKILESIEPLPATRVPILQALDRFAAENCFARLPLPMFDNSAMDGYAVVAAESKSGKRLRIVGEQPAGADRKLCIQSGQAVRIFTGAPIPTGADAIVMQEDVTRDGDEIVLNTDVESGEFVRRRGCDLTEGQKILSQGERIRAASIGVLASQGFANVAVGPPAHVAIISSGDELVETGAELQAGQIYDSNSVMLQVLVNRCNASTASTQHCHDDAVALQQEFEAAAKNDVLIVTGGVSVGEHDLVQSTLRSLGAEINIWRVAIKPGKPFLFGRIQRNVPTPQSSKSRGEGARAAHHDKSSVPSSASSAEDSGRYSTRACLVFGLPGNPVSTFVTFLQFVRPAILKLMGGTDLALPRVPAQLLVDLTNDGDRAHYFRGKLDLGKFIPVGRQESHALFGLSQSNALLRLGPGESVKADTIVEVEIWD